MRHKDLGVALLGLCLAFSSPVMAKDAFEDGPGDNLPTTTTNELNVDQVHDLEAIGGVADKDCAIYTERGKRSYEVRAWSESGEIDFLNQPVAISFFTDTGGSLGTAAGFSRAGAVARWINTLAPDFAASNRACVSTGQTHLTANAKYRFEFRETTLFCPRYNNSGTQSSVLMIQMARGTGSTCNVEAHFFNQDNGQIVGTYSSTLTQNNMLVVPAAGVTGVAGTRGHARIAHTCGNGGLKAKLVALEPSTGFSFDTICEQR